MATKTSPRAKIGTGDAYRTQDGPDFVSFNEQVQEMLENP